jgi:hypothetical protein
MLRAGFVAAAMPLASCGGGKGCGAVDKFFNEPGCHDSSVSAKRVFTGASAACGAPGSRKVQIKCPASAGSAGQCTGGETGATVVSILLDANQSTFGTCNDVVNAYAGGTLAGIVGIFVSAGVGDATTTVDCSSGTECDLTSPTCYSMWDDTNAVPTGTSANLTNNTAYEYCTYIDTANSFGLNPSIASGGSASSSWSGPIPSITTGGAGVNLLFDGSTNWVDALP